MTSLQKALRKARHAYFKWGAHDCAVCTCKLLQAHTGIPIEYPEVESRKDFVAAIKHINGRSLCDLVTFVAVRSGWVRMSRLEGDCFVVYGKPAKRVCAAWIDGVFYIASHKGVVTTDSVSDICMIWRVR